MAYTYIAAVANFTDKQISVKNHEVSREEVHDAKSAFRANDLSIPWCEDASAYAAGRKLSVSFTGAGGYGVYWLWEKNGQIYIHAKDAFDGAVVVEPDPAGGGYWKLLEFTPAANGGYSIRIIDLKIGN